MLHTTGIVFRSVKYGETSVIADIFTFDKGLHTFIAGGVRSARSKMPYGLFQPMSIVELVSYFREDVQAMHRLREAHAGEIWQGIPFDLKRGSVALFMAEICRKCILPGEPNTALFEFLTDTLRFLDHTADAVVNLPLHFLIHLAEHLGIQATDWPEDESEVFFDLKEAVFMPVPPPGHVHFMQPDETKAMMRLQQSDLETAASITLTPVFRQNLLQHLLTYYQYHVPGFSEAHTPEILHWVMHR